MNAYSETNLNTSTAIPAHIVNASMPTIEPDNAPEPIVDLSADLDREPLTRALYVAMAAIERRNTIPILSNVKIQEVKGALQVVGTDLDIEIAVTVPGSIDQGFATTIPAHQAHALLAKSRKSDFVSLQIDQENEKLAIDTENTKFNLNTLPVDDLPELHCAPFTHSFELDGSTFWNAIDSVQGAISTEETRYYLNGVYMCESQGKLRFVTTDGHRLYCQDIQSKELSSFLPIGPMSIPAAIIPRKAIATIQKLTKAAKFRPERVKISISETKFQIEFDNVCIITRLVDGTFPDYMRVIPTHNPNKMSVIAKDLSAAITDVSLVSSDKGRAIKFSLMGDVLGLSVNNPDMGSAESSIPMYLKGDGMEIGFNSKYLTDLLAVAGPGEVKFEFNDSGSPTRITGVKEGWQAVLMPMRV